MHLPTRAFTALFFLFLLVSGSTAVAQPPQEPGNSNPAFRKRQTVGLVLGKEEGPWA